MNQKSTSPVLRPASDSGALHPLIAGRWSSRAIDANIEISAEDVERLFDAARWAASAMNNQPWRFLSFGPENPGQLNRARNALNTSNAWALSAPRLIYILARSTRPASLKPNRLALYETGMAAAAMAYQAAADGLVFHQMAGFDESMVRREFKLPPTFSILVAAALGRPGSILELSEEHRNEESAPRQRLPLNRIVFHNGKVPVE